MCKLHKLVLLVEAILSQSEVGYLQPGNLPRCRIWPVVSYHGASRSSSQCTLHAHMCSYRRKVTTCSCGGGGSNQTCRQASVALSASCHVLGVSDILIFMSWTWDQVRRQHPASWQMAHMALGNCFILFLKYKYTAGPACSDTSFSLTALLYSTACTEQLASPLGCRMGSSRGSASHLLSKPVTASAARQPAMRHGMPLTVLAVRTDAIPSSLALRAPLRKGMGSRCYHNVPCTC